MIVPSSDALAASVSRSNPTLKTWLSVGLVRETVGGTPGGATTEMMFVALRPVPRVIDSLRVDGVGPDAER